MEVLDTYFRRYDEAGKGQEQMDELLALFSDDVMIVLNGAEKPGIQAFTQFLNTFFHVHEDIKHMWDGWKKEKTESMKPTGPFVENFRMAVFIQQKELILHNWTTKEKSFI